MFHKSGMRVTRIILISLILIFSALQAVIAIFGLNRSLFLEINSFASHIPSYIWANLTCLGDTLVGCSFMILFVRKRPDIVWSGLIAAVVGFTIVNLLKASFNVPRPPAVFGNESINIIGPALYHNSFPSGHTATIFTLAGILLSYFRSMALKLLTILFAFIVGISRISVGVHWPLDVLTGAVLGCACALCGIYLVLKFRWSANKPLQIIAGIIFTGVNFYLLFFYDIQYVQAVYLKFIFVGVTLIFGIKELYLLLRDK